MIGLDRDRVFVALTRPQTLAGVTYSVVILNVILTTELFLIFKTFLVFLFAALLHLTAWIACARDVRALDIWLVRASRCPRSRTWSLWRCNCYAP